MTATHTLTAEEAEALIEFFDQAASHGHVEKGEEWGTDCAACGATWPCVTARAGAAVARLESTI